MSTPSKLYLWDKRTLYVGPLPDPISLSQGAATLLISLGDDFFFKTKNMDKTVTCSSLLIPPGLSISIDTGDQIIANCNLDPLCEDLFYLSQIMTPTDENAYINIKGINEFRKVYENLWREPHNAESAYMKLDQLFLTARPLTNVKSKTFTTDSRIIEAVELIKKSVGDNLSVETLAEEIGLSEPRLMQLFKEKTGVPIRRYRLWHRLYTTSQNLTKGYSLTEAALLSGFTDSAHFSKTFKDMLGMSPTRILGQPNGIQIITEPMEK